MKYEWQTCAEFSEEKGGENSPFQIPVKKTKQKSTPGSVGGHKVYNSFKHTSLLLLWPH
jgi:hypothetical protein